MNIPTSPRERSLWVIYQLRLRGSSLAAIARRTGVSPETVRGALFTASLPQEEAIAQELGLDVRVLFPERYDAQGVRLHNVRGDKGTGVAETRHVQNRGAA